MAIAVNIDFDATYEIDTISGDLRTTTFSTQLVSGSQVPLKVEISQESHELLGEVFNLAFGPMDETGEIDDKAKMQHQNYSRVFSTILLSALNYLTTNPTHYVGIDGSDNSRAFLYYRFLQRNYQYLNKYFDIYGLKYYVRITRFGRTQYENPFDFEDIIPFPDLIQKTNKPPSKMYNYFMFRLKQ